MRPVKSRVLFEQMLGRGTRVINPTDLIAVTPDAARTFPERPLRMIVPFAAGGTADCVLKTSPDIFTRIVREAFTPGPKRKYGYYVLPLLRGDRIVGRVSLERVVDPVTGEVIVECNQEMTAARLEELKKRGIDRFRVLFIDNLYVGPYLRETLLQDRVGAVVLPHQVEQVAQVVERQGDERVLRPVRALVDAQRAAVQRLGDAPAFRGVPALLDPFGA